MRRKIVIALVSIGSGTALAMMAFALVGHGKSSASPGAVTSVSEEPQVAVLGPDTSSPNWKLLSEDVGVMIRKDDRLGLRARLYVRIDGAWTPVATDGPGDSLGFIPVR
jgi:hypothetical protein